MSVDAINQGTLQLYMIGYHLQLEFIVISPCGQAVHCTTGITNNCLLNSVGLAQAKGGFAQFKHSRNSRSKTGKAIPLAWGL